MRLFIFTVLAVAVRCQINPLCPAAPTGLVGICQFTDANCLSDDTCKGDQICCPHLCGKICKDKIVVQEACPALDPNIQVKCAWNNHQCSADSECGPTKKCCKGYCGRVCKHPVILKPNSCPIIPAGIVAKCAINVKPCKGDFMCGKGQKCCKGLCGPNCVNPITIEIRPGSCPKETYEVICKYKRDLCTHDGSCKNPTHKCCDGGCGKRCIAAVPTPDIVKPGTCPTLDPNIQVRCLTHHQCSSDGDCDDDQKCCVGYCGRRCTSPVKTRCQITPACPGCTNPLCPEQPTGFFGTYCEYTDKNCHSDDKCKGGQICCPHLCGKICKDKITVTQETCPSLDPNIQVSCDPWQRQCSVKYYDCGPNKKCCEGYCGRECKLPVILKPNSCPIIPAGVYADCPINVNTCTGDSMCGEGQKCCTGLCGPSCVNSITIEIRPGSCPNQTYDPTDVLCYKTDFCTEDGDCTNPTHKCCGGACGKRCAAAIPTPDIVKPGRCPALDPHVEIKCLIDFQCNNDGDCEGDQKCCEDYYCGMKCKDPAIPGPQCPDPTACRPNEERFACSYDGDCAYRQLCCRTTSCEGPPGRGCRDGIPWENT